VGLKSGKVPIIDRSKQAFLYPLLGQAWHDLINLLLPLHLCYESWYCSVRHDPFP